MQPAGKVPAGTSDSHFSLGVYHMVRSFASFVCGVLVLSSVAAAQEDLAVDLRAAQPKPGLKWRETTRSEMKGADVTATAEGRTLTAKMDIVQAEESECTVKAANGGQVTKFTTRIVKDESTTTTRSNDGADEQEEVGPLAGQVVVSERTASGWKHSLAEGQPTQEQKKALDALSPWDDQEEMPAGKLKIGTTWEIDAVHLKKHLGPDATAVSGKIKVTFTGVRKHNGELCAIIESAGVIKGKMVVDGADGVLTMNLKCVEYRSLKHGITLKTSGEYAMKITAKNKVQGTDVSMVVEGKGTIDENAEIRE